MVDATTTTTGTLVLMVQAEKTPKVSVCVITYNQEEFIEQCLRSILDQETTFEFEIVVGDDCSTDRTSLIVENLRELYPNVMRTIYQKINTGGTKNYCDVHAAARGQYVAHIDGDDYMLPGKLASQAGFLDANPGCAIVAHEVYSVYSNQVSKIKSNSSRAIVKTDLVGLVRNYLTFTHSSKMYRRNACSGIVYEGKEIIDFVFHVDHAAKGWIAVLPEYLGCRRTVPHSITSVSGKKLYALVDYTREGFKHALRLGVPIDDVRFGEANYLLKSAIFCAERGDRIGFELYINESFRIHPFLSLSQRIIYRIRHLFFIVNLVSMLRRSVKRAASAFN